MFARRVLAAILVAIPTVAAVILVQWMPLSDLVKVQWSALEATNTLPLWLFLLPIAVVTILGLGMAIAVAVARDRKEPYRGTLYIAAVLTSGSAGVFVATLAVNLGYAAPTGPAFLGALALAPIYALVPLTVVARRARTAPKPESDPSYSEV